MPQRLLSKALAALEWGWYDGLCLIDRGHDELLRELLVYMDAKKRRRWSAYPVYRSQMADRETGFLENAVKVSRLDPDRGNRPFGHNVWWLARYWRFTSVYIEPDCLCAVRVQYREVDQFQYLQLDCMAEEGGTAHYYLSVHDWVARCSTPSECVALLDAIDSFALYEDFIARIRKYYFFRHLEALTRRCHDDPPRMAYIQRAMDKLEQGCGGYEYNL